MTKSDAVFRSAFVPLWRYCTTASATITGGVLIAMGLPLTYPQIVTTILCAALTPIPLALGIAFFPVRVNSDGLYCYDVFCIYRLAPWQSIETVRPVNLLGLRYLLVHSNQLHRSLMVPLFLKNIDRFGEVVAGIAGSEHPLVRALPRDARRTSRCA